MDNPSMSTSGLFPFGSVLVTAERALSSRCGGAKEQWWKQNLQLLFVSVDISAGNAGSSCVCMVSITASLIFLNTHWNNFLDFLFFQLIFVITLSCALLLFVNFFLLFSPCSHFSSHLPHCMIVWCCSIHFVLTHFICHGTVRSSDKALFHNHKEAQKDKGRRGRPSNTLLSYS